MTIRNGGNWRSKSTLLKIGVFGIAAGVLASPSLAVHSWSNYHWKRTTTQISPPVGDNVTSVWQSYYEMAVADWNKSTVIESPLAAGQTTPKRCNPVDGTIQVCNEAYGRNGWLGLASIWLSDGHIIKGTTKVNDSYYTTGSKYDTYSWRAAVMCQEIGHDYGLGHQDENQNDDLTNSCMEYTNDPTGNEHPDQHDYDQLLLIYNHTESSSTTASKTASSGSGNTPAEWGRAIDHDAHGRPHMFMRPTSDGQVMITHVYWVPKEGGHDH